VKGVMNIGIHRSFLEKSKNISTHAQHLTVHQYFSNPRLFFYHLPSSTHKHET
jgi:hypothetical protein